jgi:cytochrome P450
MDLAFLVGGIEWNFPWLAAGMARLPIPSMQDLVNARERLADFGKAALQDYVERYGRDSGRRDLLTKILSTEGTKATLTDRDVYLEISNLVFAGTGESNLVRGIALMLITPCQTPRVQH